MESFLRRNEYLVLTFNMTSTGVAGLPSTMRTVVTLPISTPANRTGAPILRPLALSKYDFRTILRVSQPPVPLIIKIRTAKVTLANTTVSPTRSCDHFSCFWLGNLVCERQKHHNKRARRFRVSRWRTKARESAIGRRQPGRLQRPWPE